MSPNVSDMPYLVPMHPVIHVVCQQRGCFYEGLVRQVHLRRVGVDIFRPQICS